MVGVVACKYSLIWLINIIVIIITNFHCANPRKELSSVADLVQVLGTLIVQVQCKVQQQMFISGTYLEIIMKCNTHILGSAILQYHNTCSMIYDNDNCKHLLEITTSDSFSF